MKKVEYFTFRWIQNVDKMILTKNYLHHLYFGALEIAIIKAEDTITHAVLIPVVNTRCKNAVLCSKPARVVLGMGKIPGVLKGDGGKVEVEKIF